MTLRWRKHNLLNMVWSVILEDENKNAITSLDKDFISKDIVDATINKEFKLIKYLDPYGDTVFNRLQIDDLILDLDGLIIIRKWISHKILHAVQDDRMVIVLTYTS